MPTGTPNKGKPWTAMEVMRLRALAKAGAADGGSSKTSDKKGSLKPTNRRGK
jgi:hypothetical protein